MRLIAASGIALAVAALAAGADAREVSIYRGKCGEVVLPQGPTGLDSAIRVDTRCGTFGIDRHGIRFIGVRKPGSVSDRLVWRRGRLVFYDRGRITWRSAHRHPRWAMGSWLAGDGPSLAFQYERGPLYVADLEGSERAVGLVGEHPIGWTEAGLLLTWHRSTLRARTRSGQAVAQLRTASNVLHRFDSRTRTLLFVSSSRELMRTDGRHTQRLALLEPLGLGGWPEIVPLEAGRVALVGNRLVVIGSDGSVVATDGLRGSIPAISSHGAIAMVSTGRLDDRGRTNEAVRLLRPGERSSTLLHVNEVGALGCGHWPTLAWRGEELLYATSEGHVAVITPRSGEHLDLTRVVSRLPGEFLEARWS